MKVQDILQLLADNKINVHDDIQISVQGGEDTFFPTKIQNFELRFQSIQVYAEVLDKHKDKYKKEINI